MLDNQYNIGYNAGLNDAIEELLYQARSQRHYAELLEDETAGIAGNVYDQEILRGFYKAEATLFILAGVLRGLVKK